MLVKKRLEVSWIRAWKALSARRFGWVMEVVENS